MGQSIDCQPHFGHQVGRRKASYANHAAQVGEKTAVCLLSDRLLGAAWTEAILRADLTREEREQWADQLAAWHEELDDYGVDEAFDAPQTAALDGWDYPPLQRVLQGRITEQGAW